MKIKGNSQSGNSCKRHFFSLLVISSFLFLPTLPKAGNAAVPDGGWEVGTASTSSAAASENRQSIDTSEPCTRGADQKCGGECPIQADNEFRTCSPSFLNPNNCTCQVVPHECHWVATGENSGSCEGNCRITGGACRHQRTDGRDFCECRSTCKAEAVVQCQEGVCLGGATRSACEDQTTPPAALLCKCSGRCQIVQAIGSANLGLGDQSCGTNNNSCALAQSRCFEALKLVRCPTGTTESPDSYSIPDGCKKGTIVPLPSSVPIGPVIISPLGSGTAGKSGTSSSSSFSSTQNLDMGSGEQTNSAEGGGPFDLIGKCSVRCTKLCC